MAQNDGDVSVSDGARAAIGRAIETLRPHMSEPRVRALASKLNAIQSPEGSDEREDEIAKAMISADRISKSETCSPDLRARAQATSRELQRAYLSKHSAGYSVWENSAREAGLVD